MSLKSRLNTCSFLEDIITSSNEVFDDFESTIGDEIWMLGNTTWETAKSYIIVKYKAGS